jgi:lactate dehydrogenase-like 2-hydroxyacid dehydrogenase
VKKVIDLQAARKAAEQKKYKSAVLDVFDQLEHNEKRAQQDKGAEVRRNARNKL